jgi:cysteine desulfurase
MERNKRVYLDNAATTAVDSRVLDVMQPFFMEKFGNPSSIHAHGREVRTAIEQSRRTVAELTGAAPSEIFFTSGATESINTVLRGAIEKYGVKHVITSPIEHHAVLHTLDHLKKSDRMRIHHVRLDETGRVAQDELERLLHKYPGSLVALMYVNNEIGNITDMEQVGQICAASNAWFLCDTVQALGHLPIDLNGMAVQAIAGSAHKFHGPKGVGFLYLKAGQSFEPLLLGGGQERNMRGGTENVAGIIGLAKALELAYEEKEATSMHLWELKKYAMDLLKAGIEDVVFNGASGHRSESLNKILSIGLPGYGDTDMLLFNLDIRGISVSGGSACASGSSIGSHVMEALNVPEDMAVIRISFSKFNTKEDIDYFVVQLKNIIKENI